MMMQAMRMLESTVADHASEIFEKSESIFTYVIKFCALAIEIIGVCIVVFSVVRAVIGIFKKNAFLRLNLAEGIALALEFKMGGELLRTVIARDWSELLILGAVVLLRAAMAFLIQWEIRIEKKNGMTVHGLIREEEEKEKKAEKKAKKDEKDEKKEQAE